MHRIAGSPGMFSPSITSTKREPIFSFLFESKYLLIRISRRRSDGAAALAKYAEDYIGRLATEANRLTIHAGRKTIRAVDVNLAASSL